MENKISSMEDLIEWDEVANLGLPEPHSIFSLSLESFFHLGGSIDENKKIEEDILQKIKNLYEEAFPDSPIPFRSSLFWITVSPVEQYKNKFCFSILPFFLEFLNFNYGFYLSKKFTFPSAKSTNVDNIVEFKKEAKENLRQKRDFLKSYCYDGSFPGLPDSFIDHLKNQVYQSARQCNWLLKNVDRMVEFLSSEIPASIFSSIGKDKMLAFLAFSAGHLIELDRPLVEGVTHEMIISPVENYLLLVDYLESILGRKYRLVFDVSVEVIEDENRGFKVQTFSIEDIREYLKQFYQEFPDVMKRENRPNSYEEVLKNRAVHTWKRIQNEKMLHQIQLNWEFLPQKKLLSEGGVSSLRSTRERKTHLVDSLQLKRDYDHLDRKLSFWESTNPLCVLSGIHTFEGYQAYMYPNGLVAFEKFFENRKKGSYPAKDSAIYIMRFDEFLELSKYSKSELIQEIQVFNNPDLIRICHSGDWEMRVKQKIQGIGYGEIDLQCIEELTRDLSTKAVNKTKKLDG